MQQFRKANNCQINFHLQKPKRCNNRRGWWRWGGRPSLWSPCWRRAGAGEPPVHRQLYAKGVTLRIWGYYPFIKAKSMLWWWRFWWWLICNENNFYLCWKAPRTLLGSVSKCPAQILTSPWHWFLNAQSGLYREGDYLDVARMHKSKHMKGHLGPPCW